MKSKPVEYLPGAQLDLEESVAWYEAKDRGAGNDFTRHVESTEQTNRVESIAANFAQEHSQAA